MSISAFILNNKNKKNCLKEIKLKILYIIIFNINYLVLHFPIKNFKN